jgi:tripartite-type tricarboxylate transporter receptor subunit TctC
MRYVKSTILLATFCVIAGAPETQAEGYPSKLITLVAPYSAGGASDLAARTLASVAPTYLGQPVLVVNRTGAGGITGSATVNKARPTGYTLLLARIGSQSIAPAMRQLMPYKYDDFTMIGLLELNPVLCATAVTKPYKSLQTLIAAVRARPGELRYSSAGTGSLLHIAVPYLLDTVGVKDARNAMRHVPYKGGGQAASAAVAGDVDLVCTNSSALAGYIAAGKLRPLLVTTKRRIAVAKSAPTVGELGYPQLQKLIGWSALFGPPNLPPEVVAKLRDMLQKVKTDKAWNRFTTALGSVPRILDGPTTKKFVDGQYKAFSDLVAKLEMKIK